MEWETWHMDDSEGLRPAAAVLWWIPVGAGGHLVRHASSLWEAVHAMGSRRTALTLFHAALEVTTPEGGRFTIEMVPAWGVGRKPDRGVVTEGPVGLRALGRSRFFRYEIRCWSEGTIPDLRWSVGGPVTLTNDQSEAHELIRHIREVPALTWGRNVGTTGDMWNSNSLVSWLMVKAGFSASQVHPPEGGRAPGWRAGIAVANDTAHQRL